MNFNEFFRENMTYDDIKSDHKRELYFPFRQYNFLNIFLGLRCGFFFVLFFFFFFFFFFLNKASVLVSAELAIFHSM